MISFYLHGGTFDLLLFLLIYILFILLVLTIPALIIYIVTRKLKYKKPELAIFSSENEN